MAAHPEYDIQIEQARQSAPSPTSAFYACHSAAFFMRLMDRAERESSRYKNEHDRYAEKHSKALAHLIKEDPKTLAMLRNGDLATLAQYTIGIDFKNLEQIKEIYSFYNPEKDLNFTFWDAQKKLQLMDAIDQDESIQKIIRGSGDQPLSDQDMRYLSERITEMQYRIYGYGSPIVAFIQTERDIAGVFSDNTGVSMVMLNETKLQGQPASEVIKTILHENDHAFEADIAARFDKIYGAELTWLIENEVSPGYMSSQKYEDFKKFSRDWIDKNLPGGLNDDINKELMIGGRLRESAMAFHFSDRHYFQPEDKVHGYLDNPKEQHAFRAEKVGDYIFANESDKKLIRQEFERYIEHAKAAAPYIQAENAALSTGNCSAVKTPAFEALSAGIKALSVTGP